mmetsp:Transcript_4714/g.17579  ORF Transcript_4714/g.17579 Transcript_4714/m.17579 type:complete len:281 (+) Transcript_4714:469-1311(+)
MHVVVQAAVHVEMVVERGIKLAPLPRLPSSLQDEWLGKQHDGHRCQRNQHEEHLEPSLAPKHDILGTARLAVRALAGAVRVARGEKHVDHDVVQVRRRAGRGPLHDHQDDQVAKEAAEKYHLRDELADNAEEVPGVQKVEQAHEYPQHHLRHAHDDGHLHLERVQERQLGLCAVPDRVHAESVHAAIRALLIAGAGVFWIASRPLRGPEPVHRHGEALVVQQSGIYAEYRHEQDAVPAVKHHLHDFLLSYFPQFFLVVHQIKRRQQHQNAVAKVPKHHRE